MAIVLHYSPTDASLAPHLWLAELGVPYTLALVDRSVEAQRSARYLALNPNGLIPVLVDGEAIVFETAAILLHLTDRYAPPALQVPLGGGVRSEFYKWLVWSSSTLHAQLIPYFYPERLVEAGNADGARQVKAASQQRVGALLDILEAQLGSSPGPWFLGDRYSAIDPYLLMLGGWTRRFVRPAASLPALGAYLRRVADRAASRAVFGTEGIDALHWLATSARSSAPP